MSWNARGIVTQSVIVLAMVVAVRAQEEPPPASSADTLFQMGVKRLSIGQYELAGDDFRRVAELEPGNPRGIIGMAQVYVAEKRVAEGLRLLQSEAAKFPTMPELHLAIGNVALAAGKYDLAIAEFQRLLDGTDRNSRNAAGLYLRLGEAYRHKGDLDFSATMFEQAQRLDPGNPTAGSGLALVMEARGQKEAAEAQYRKIVEANPDNALAINNLAFVLADQSKDLDMALAYAHRARQLAPNDPSVADTLGWVYVKMNNPDEALTILREVVRKDSGRAVFHYHLAAALEQKGERAEAVKELDLALKRNPSPAEEQIIKELRNKIEK
jgi:tetratricopeptide (TPR) repeat protein